MPPPKALPVAFRAGSAKQEPSVSKAFSAFSRAPGPV